MQVLANLDAKKSVPTELAQQAEDHLTVIFNRLKGSHLGWRANIKTQAEYDNARREWLRLLLKHRLTAKEIQRGLEIADVDKNPFLPSFGQFLEWCKLIDYAELGLPSVEQLLKRLNYFASFGFEGVHEFKFNSNAEYWLLTDLYERNRKYSWKDEVLRNQAEKALNAMVKRVQAGEQIPAPNLTLPEKSTSYQPPQAVIDERFSALRKTLGVSK